MKGKTEYAMRMESMVDDLKAENERLREAIKNGIRILRNDPGDPERLTESDQLNHDAEKLLREALK